MKFFSTFLITFITITTTTAQAKSDIYVLDFKRYGNGRWVFDNPIFVNSDNRGGYNNQPNFIGDLLFVSSQRDGQQTDIYCYDFSKERVYNITQTDDIKEYSPTPVPNRNALSTVCIEEDGKTQRLWQYSLENPLNKSLIFEDIFNVGYHHWINNEDIALFIVGKPHELHIANARTKRSKKILHNIGRTFKSASTNELYFIHKSTEAWYIKTYNIIDQDFKTIIKTLPKIEDYVVLKDGTFLMGHKNLIYKFNPAKDKDWIPVCDLQDLGVTEITRLAIGKGKIAVVTSR